MPNVQNLKPSQLDAQGSVFDDTAPTPLPGHRQPSLLHTKCAHCQEARGRFETLKLIPASSPANATKHNQASEWNFCTLGSLRPPSQRPTNHTQSGFRMEFFRFNALGLASTQSNVRSRSNWNIFSKRGRTCNT